MHTDSAILLDAHLQLENCVWALPQRGICSTQISGSPEQRVFLPDFVEVILWGLQSGDIEQHAVGIIGRLDYGAHQRVGMSSESDVERLKVLMTLVEKRQRCGGHREQQLDQQHERNYPSRHGVPSHESLPVPSGSRR